MPGALTGMRIIIVLLAACVAEPGPGPGFSEFPEAATPLAVIDTSMTVDETGATELAWSCFEAALVTPADCNVEVVLDAASSHVVPACGLGVEAELCWQLRTDHVACPATAERSLAIEVVRWPAGRYHVRATCSTR